MPRPSAPIYFAADSEMGFGLFDAPESSGDRRPAVLICPPWGWDEVASYRARRDWAKRLAEAGHPTLRISLPATGGSGGSPGDPGLAGSWVASVKAAAVWLKEKTGGTALAAIGLGLGGLLGVEALAAEAPIDDLALWASPATGRRFLRETRAFSALQKWHGADSPPGLDDGLPEGWLEAGGFSLSAETMEALSSFELHPRAATALRRLLVLERDGTGSERGRFGSFEESGIEVSHVPGFGWGDFVSHPERSRLPRDVAEQVERWLRAPATGRPSSASGIVVADHLTGAGFTERPLEPSYPWGTGFALLSEPVERPQAGGLCAVFLNAGAVRSNGPNRLWTETARRWAAQGIPAVCVDLEGIGEADGEPAGSLSVGDFYQERYGAQVSAVLDELDRSGVGSRFLLVGLCAGGYWAFRTAVADRRVSAAVGLNAGALRWDPDLVVWRESRKAARAFEGNSWRKLMRGEVGWRKLGVLFGSMTRRLFRALRAAVPGRRSEPRGVAALATAIEADLDVLREAGTPVTIAFSGAEPLAAELAASGIRGRAESWPNVEFHTLPGDDHTLRPIAAQRAAAELLDRELSRQIAAAPPQEAPAPLPSGWQR